MMTVSENEPAATPESQAKRVNGAVGEQELERAIAGVSTALDYEANGSNPATEEDSKAVQADLRTALAILNKLSPEKR